MNIFATSPDPVVSALMLDDRRLNKMASETAQIICTVARAVNPEKARGDNMLWKATHANHPCTLWAGASKANFQWLVAHGAMLCAEHRIRRLTKAKMKGEKIDDKPHAALEIILHAASYYPYVPDGEQTPFANCTDYKDESDVHLAYQKQLSDKWLTEYRNGFNTKFTGHPSPPFYMLTWPVGPQQ
ncbi:MAG: pyrimidine dimer DNA glycosylase/endonuclease V [Nitrospira sp.]